MTDTQRDDSVLTFKANAKAPLWIIFGGVALFLLMTGILPGAAGAPWTLAIAFLLLGIFKQSSAYVVLHSDYIETKLAPAAGWHKILYLEIIHIDEEDKLIDLYYRKSNAPESEAPTRVKIRLNEVTEEEQARLLAALHDRLPASVFAEEIPSNTANASIVPSSDQATTAEAAPDEATPTPQKKTVTATALREEVAKQSQRRTLLICGGIVAFVVVVVLGAIGHSWYVDKETARILETGKNLVAEGKIQEAASVFAERPGLSSSEEEAYAFDRAFAEALVARGEELRAQGKNDEALSVYEEISRRFGNNSTGQQAVSTALIGKATILESQGKLEEAMSAYGALAQKGRAAPSADLARKLVDMGFDLNKKNKPDEALAIFDNVIEKLGGAYSTWSHSEESQAVSAQIARAYYYKGMILNAKDNHKEAVSVYTKFAQLYGANDSRETKQWAAKAVKDILYGRQPSMPEIYYGQHPDITKTDAFIDKIAQSGDKDAIETAMATAFLIKMDGLVKKGKTREVVDIYEAVDYEWNSGLNYVIRHEKKLLKDKEDDDYDEQRKAIFVEADRYLKQGHAGFRAAATVLLSYMKTKIENGPDDAFSTMVGRAMSGSPYAGLSEHEMRRSFERITEFDNAMKKIYGDETDPEIKALLKKLDSSNEASKEEAQ